MKIEIDEKILDKGSHIEIRKRKDGIVILEIPKGKQIQIVSAEKQEKA